MLSLFKSKTLTIGLIFSFLLFTSPFFLRSENGTTGNLVGYVYESDETTPVEGAVVKMRNVSTGTLFESSKTDQRGAFKLESAEPGLYVVGVSTTNGNFNIENLIGVRENETAKVSLVLKMSNKQSNKQKTEEKKKKKGLLGFFTSPVGIAIIAASSVVIVYTVIELTEGEEEASPFRN
jgi:hypothetical protein